MDDAHKTKAVLINELARLRGKVNRLERSRRQDPLPGKPLPAPSVKSPQVIRAHHRTSQLDARYRDLFENSGTGIIIVDENGKFLLVNKIAASGFGRLPIQVAGKSMFDLLPRETAEHYLAFNRELFKTGGDRVYEDTFRLPSGDRSYLIVDHCLTDERGKPFALQSCSIDITERRRAEKALKESEERYRVLVEESPEPIIVHFDGKLLYVNPAGVRLIGARGLDELRGRSIFEFIHPEDREGVKKRLEPPAYGQVFRSVEQRIVTLDGAVLHVESTSIPVTYEEKPAVQIIVRDLSERMQAAARLRQNEVDLAEAQRVAKIGSWNLDLPSDTVRWSEELYRIFEIDKAGFVGLYESFLNRIHPDDRDLVRETNRQARTTGGPFEVEYRIATPSGQLKNIRETGYATRDSSGNLVGLFGVARDITEQTQTQEALRESEERWRSLVANSPDFIALHDRDGKYLFLNHYAEGFSEERVLGKSVYDFVSPETRELYRTAFQECLRSMVAQQVEFSASGDRASTRMYESTLVPIKGQRDEINVLMVAKDITERRHSQEALAESEERYRRLVEQSPDAILVHAGGKVMYANPAAVLLAGATRTEELLGKSFLDFVHPDSRAIVIERVGELAGGIDVPLIEEKLIRLDGTILNCEVNSIPTTYGGMSGAQVVIRDVSGRKRAEGALRESEERYRDLVEHSLDLICTHDMDGKLLSVNPAATKLTGYSEHELVGGNLRGFLTPVGKRLFNNYLSRILKTGSDSGLLPVVTKNGEERVWEYFNTLRTVGVPAPIIRGLARDVTERKRAEKSLLRSEEQLHQLAGHLQNVREEERKHLSQEFHDQLGQTLTALKMDLTLLQREMSDTTKDFSRVALSEKIRSMQGLIDNGTNAIRETMSQLRPELLDQLGLVAALEWEVEKFEERSRVKCHFSSGFGELPLDPEKSIALFRIFQEAMTNVARHADATAVDISVRREDRRVVLEIRDNGIGIEPNAESKAHSFGLIGMRERTILLGGTLEVKGVKGEGTTIIVRMPDGHAQTDGGTGYD